MSAARRFVKGAGAALVLLALVAGLPIVLWVVAGNPVPDQIPDLGEIRTTLSMPDYTGSVLLGVLKYVAWAGWALLVWIVAAETVAAVAHRPARASGTRARPVPGLGGLQRLAAALVAAVLLTGAQADNAQAAHGQTPQAVAAPVAAFTSPGPATTAPTTADVQPGTTIMTEPTKTVTVAKGDSLWELAREHLGDPARWKEIYTLNEGRTMTTGHVMNEPGWLEPGWELLVPDLSTDDTPAQTVQTTTHTVQRGDTLSQIAKDRLGDADRYPEIFDASTGTVQPDGRHLVDPDRIYPGWQVTVPGTVAPDVPVEPDIEQAPADTPGDSPEAHPETTDGLDDDGASSAQGDRAASDEKATAPGRAVPDQAGPDTSRQSSGVQEWAPWVLGGLTGAGAVLAGSMWLLLRARRRARWRHRRPGRTLAAPGPLLAPVEKTVVTVGPSTSQMVEYLDAVLRRLGAVVATNGGSMPDLVAVELTGAHVVLHLGGPWELGAPWEGTDDGHCWQIPVGLTLDRVGPAGDHPAPYPLLVTVGSADDGSVWLFNMEDLAITLTGETERAQGFARYLVAEIGCSPWAAWTTVDCVGLGAELVGLNPDRIRYHDPRSADDPVGNALAEAMTAVGRATAAGTDVVTARSMGVGAQSWSPQVVLVDATSDDPALDPLLDIVAQHAGQTGTSVVVAGSRSDGDGVHIEVTAEGRVRLPEVGLDLVAVGLDITEAAGCAGLAAQAEIAVDPVPVPYLDDTVDTGWRSWSDAAGSLRPEHTAPRTSDTWCDAQSASSVLPAADATYLQAAATTPDDLALLAPQVPTGTRSQVEAADPELEADLAAWVAPSTTRPRVRVLGPVQVAAVGITPTRRQPFFAELVVYLALHPAGVTPAHVAEAFSTSRDKAREYLRIVRQWLGVDPGTGVPYLHEDDQEVCQADVLCDLDLFRRLRIRAQARGAEGTDDLLAALRLVAGQPFHGRAAGWAWLVVDDRPDEAALIAVIDAAHTVVTGALAAADLPTARWAAETAQQADPYDEIIRLDLAAIASAEGRYAEAARIVTHDIANRSDDGHAPPDLSDRTQEIIVAHPDWNRTRAS